MTAVSAPVFQWVPDQAPGTMIKIDNPNQFVPVGTNSKEVKAKVKEVCPQLVQIFNGLALG